MRWRGGRESENVEDRRDEGGAGDFNFPGGVSFPSGGGSGGGGIGIIGILIILGLMWFFGLDPTVLMQGGVPQLFFHRGRCDLLIQILQRIFTVGRGLAGNAGMGRHPHAL